KYSIEEAFRECFYIIPDYQREYVWTDKEVHQLLEDINEQIDTGSTREYFIGTVLVSPTEHKSHYEVIDGQQRLTTFFLLLCALRHLLQKEPEAQHLNRLISDSYTTSSGIETRLKLDPRYENASEVMGKLVEINDNPVAVRSGIQAAGIASFGSLENLINAYATLYRYLRDNYDDVTKLKRYWAYLANNVIFFQISTPDVSSALKIFETINERGVGLNPMDLLKNLLFTKVRSEDFSKLKDEWKKITKPLEKGNEKPLRFLRYFLMANYPVKNEKGESVIYEDKIYDWFINKDNAALCGYVDKPFEFVRKIIRNVDHYINFTRGRGNDGNVSLAMDSLKRLAGGAFSLHYVLLLAAAPLSKPLFDHFVTQLESFLFYYIFTKTPTKDLEKSFSTWADELREVAAIGDAVMQKAKINAFVVEHFQKNMDGKTQELSDALKRLSLGSMQKYRIKYLLDRLTQHVDMAYRGEKGSASLAPYTPLEIEHILPDNPTAELRAAWTTENPAALYDDYKARLGNLTLLEKPHNIVASNNFYAEKLKVYHDSNHYLTSSLAGLTSIGQNTSVSRINEKLKAFPAWNAAAIDERHALLMGLAQDIWKTTPIDA
ncbi:MAG: DUF262 domain-containing protein, partial [Alphaproteobacteria bacterium]|nr:DUF262 domain-containing protein [Alphaproteobacteria bacterium]